MRRNVLSASCLVFAALWQVDAQAPKDRPGARPGEVNTPPAKGERVKDTLKVGSVAPDFELPHVNGKKDQVKLSSFRGKKPVVLVFGSLT